MKEGKILSQRALLKPCAKAVYTLRGNQVLISETPGLWFGRTTSQAYRQALTSAWLAVPEKVRDIFTHAGVRVVATRTARELYLGDCGIEGWKSDPLGRSYPDHFTCRYSPSSTEVLMREFRLSEKQKPWDVPLPTKETIDEGKWVCTGYDAPLLHHECAHALDHGVSKGALSKSQVFRMAFQKDFFALGGEEAAIEKGYGYFVRPEKGVVPHELFAELWAEVRGGSYTGIVSLMERGRNLSKDWAESYAWVLAQDKELLRQLASSSRKRGVAMSTFTPP